jgi:cytochrome c oxidase cbb3-type subunit 3
MPTKIEKDIVSGTSTTGHEWDGIKELDTPMPKWWVYTFMACVAWAVGYCVLYPSVPYGPGYFHGVLNYSSRDHVNAEVAAVTAARAGSMDRIAALSYDAIRADAGLAEVAQVAGRAAFANNCQACHAAGGAGRVGYPALAAGAWIWGGTTADIEQTLRHGIRSGDPDARASQMPRFGADAILDAAQLTQVGDFVWTKLYGHADPRIDTTKGAAVFAENCVACHGEAGQGVREVGGPRLASRVHLYGDTRQAIASQLRLPRAGVMPNWGTRLDNATLKSLVLYVHSLGGGE